MVSSVVTAAELEIKSRETRTTRDARGGGSGDPIIQTLPMRYRLIATDARLNRQVIGVASETVDGVPAQPVDSMTYDGVGHRKIDGKALLEIDPTRETGLLLVRFADEHGSWTIRQTLFVHPEHSSGVRMGTSRDDWIDLINLGVAQNVYLHGDTGAGMPVTPTVFAYLATWGLAEVERDGESFKNPYGWPGPDLWLSHAMLTEGLRDETDGTVRAETGEIYNPGAHADRGRTEPDDLEFHVTFHDERFPTTDNFPPLFEFQYHLVFEDVVVSLIDSQDPVSLRDLD